jgi:hypothetical protein
MNKTILALILAGGLAAPVCAQDLSSDVVTVEPRTHLSPLKWLKFIASYADLSLFANTPELMVYNGTPTAITIKCDDAKYDLVGRNKYNKENPNFIAAFSYAPIKVRGWDGWCKGQSLKAYPTTGIAVYQGIMDKSGDFMHSRWIGFVDVAQ